MRRTWQVAATLGMAVVGISLSLTTSTVSATAPACTVRYNGINMSKFAARLRPDGSILCAWKNPGGYYPRYGLASISKLVTTLTVLQLAERGDIALDQPFLRQVPAGTFMTPTDSRWNRVTVRNLMSHRSGTQISKSWYFSSRGAASRGGSWNEIARRATSAPLQFSPGSSYRYSNTNFVILGRIIAAKTGVSFESAVRTLTLDRLGLGSDDIRFVAEDGPAAADYRYPGFAQWKVRALGPAGGWNATAPAAARLAQGFDVLLSSSTRLDAFAKPSGGSYKTGVMNLGSGVYGHSGTIYGVYAIAGVDKNTGNGAAILYNGTALTSGTELKYRLIALV